PRGRHRGGDDRPPGFTRHPGRAGPRHAGFMSHLSRRTLLGAAIGFADKARPPSKAELEMIRRAAARLNEAKAKELLGAKRWRREWPWGPGPIPLSPGPRGTRGGRAAGYTGPGGKTMRPARAGAKLARRLVPDMTADAALAALKAHLRKRGYGDLEVNM